MNSDLWTEHLAHWKQFLTERLSSINDIGERVKIERQLKVIEQVQYAAVLNPKLLIEFINPSDTPSLEADCGDFFLTLNESQQKAVKSALGDCYLSLIQGPPGTGKTQVIAEICLQLYRQNPNVRILVCSETHIAVNNLISRISKHNEDIRIVRIRDKEQNSEVDEYSPESIMRTYSEWLRENCKIDAIVDVITNTLSNYEDISLEKALALSANIVGMTCNRVGAYAFYSLNEMFDVAIVDEACKATLPEILMPLTAAKRAILVGDPKQLPPVFCSEEIEIIRSIDNCNLLNHMYIDELFLRSNNVTFLNKQYRMINQIGDLINKLFYSGKLINGRNEDAEDCILWIDYVPTQTWPLNEVDIEGKQKIYNLNECEIITKVIMNLDAKSRNGTSVAIITPYKHQVLMLRKLLQTESLRNLDINIDSVDGFQGKECDVVIFSITRTVGSFRFLADERRLNVALSRARDKLIIIGNLDYTVRNSLLKAVSAASKIQLYDEQFSLMAE
jgi:ATP-dependent RNA/DNA helicase IGHMBP2